MKEWLSKNVQLLTFVFLVLNLFGLVSIPFLKDMPPNTNMMKTLKRIDLKLNEKSLALRALEKEMAGIRTPEEVDTLVNKWKQEDNIRLAVLETVMFNEFEREKLRESVFSEAVFKALDAHIL